MKDLLKLVRECKEELDAIGIEYRTVRNWTVNTRSKRRWGQCKVVSSDVFDINISVRLLADQVSDTAAKDTIIHELLHTVEGCLKHTGKWKALAEKVNRAYPQYHIKRATTEEEKGFEKTARTVSYTHLDVYKRQVHDRSRQECDFPNGRRDQKHGDGYTSISAGSSHVDEKRLSAGNKGT